MQHDNYIQLPSLIYKTKINVKIKPKIKITCMS